MKKSTVSMLQAGAFVLAITAAFIFKEKEESILIIGGIYWGFVLIIHLVFKLTNQTQQSDQPKRNFKEKGKKKGQGNHLLTVVAILGFILVFPTWIFLATRICPLDYSEAQALNCISPEICFGVTLIALYIIIFVLALLYYAIDGYTKGESEVVEIPASFQDLMHSIIKSLTTICQIIIMVLLVYYGTMNWGTILTEDTFVVKHLWKEEHYQLKNMDSYYYDSTNHSASIEIHGETYNLKATEYNDETTGVFDEKYDTVENFFDYLFCEKYTYIQHQIKENNEK